MTTFAPRPLQRFHCLYCGAAKRAHHPDTGACPVRSRPDDAAAARRALADAEASGDPARIFVARGDYQRLVGRE